LCTPPKNFHNPVKTGGIAQKHNLTSFSQNSLIYLLAGSLLR
jgi:hypothetical protein